jgi:hypothetical protein
MKTQRDQLDDAIDAVTARMTHVDDDPALASRIVAALPERVSWFGWLFHSWAPRLALVAVVVASGWLWNRVATPAVVTPLPAVARIQPVRMPTTVVATAAPEPNRTKPLEPLELLEPVAPSKPLDHERSLPPIEAPAALALVSLASVSLPEDAPLTLAPLAIADLPLTAESISPR